MNNVSEKLTVVDPIHVTHGSYIRKLQIQKKKRHCTEAEKDAEIVMFVPLSIIKLPACFLMLFHHFFMNRLFPSSPIANKRFL